MTKETYPFHDFFAQLLNLTIKSNILPGFHILGKSQTIGNFTFCRPSQTLWIYRIFARGLSQISDYEFGGNGKCVKN